MRFVPVLLVVPVAISAIFVVAGCGEKVSCENLCTRTLVCEVDFAPSDDLEGAKIDTGERTELESCTLGCEENPAVTPESALCVDEVTNASQDPAVCQPQVLQCFGAQVSEA
jgi:hypothetical protein